MDGGPRTFRTVQVIPSVAAVYDRTAVVVVIPVAAVVLGVWVYRDADRRGHDEWAPLVGAVVGGLFIAGSLPGLVALAVAEDAAIQGFPTALRIVPGFVALGLYLLLR